MSRLAVIVSAFTLLATSSAFADDHDANRSERPPQLAAGDDLGLMVFRELVASESGDAVKSVPSEVAVQPTKKP
jgi:hypothetical protein